MWQCFARQISENVNIQTDEDIKAENPC
jgi:hypothetical protein